MLRSSLHIITCCNSTQKAQGNLASVAYLLVTVAYKNKQKETQNNFTAYRAKAAFAILMRKN
jgi:hypothetical protein